MLKAGFYGRIFFYGEYSRPIKLKKEREIKGGELVTLQGESGLMGKEGLIGTVFQFKTEYRTEFHPQRFPTEFPAQL